MKRGFEHWIAIGILLASIVLVFGHTITFGFVSDDHIQVEQADFRAPWTNAFTQPVAENYYRPVFKMYMRAVGGMFGTQAEMWHLFSLAAHALAVLALYWLGLVIGLQQRWALIAALIMAIHPLHVESVAWISGVSDPILTIFFAASVAAYIQWRRHGSKKWLVTTLIAGCLALLSKETAVMLLPVLLVAEYFLAKKEPRNRSVWAALAAFCAFTIAFLAVRNHILHGFSHVRSHMTIAEMLFTWPTVLLLYLKHLFWPSQLSFFYDVPIATGVTRPVLIGLIALIAAVSAIAFLIWKYGSTTVWFAAWWIPLLLAPVLYLPIYIYGELAHDRYLYLPLFGFAIIAVVLISKLPCIGNPLLGFGILQFSVIAMGFAAMGTASFAQSLYYRSDLLLYYRAYQLQPNHELAMHNLGVELFRRGMLPQALELYSRALSRYPDNWVMQYNYALALHQAKRTAEANDAYRKTISLNSEEPAIWIRWAAMNADAGDPAQAITILKEAARHLPKEADIPAALGSILERQGDLEAAKENYRRALALRPGFLLPQQRLAALADHAIRK